MSLAVALAPDLRGASVALVGRLGRVPRRRLARAVQERAATLTRGIVRQSDALAIGHGAVSLLRIGRLDAILAQADARGLRVLSENALLRLLGLLPALPPEPRIHGLRELAAAAGLDPATARLLALFDIIEEADGRYSFRDIKAARDVARKLGDHADLAAALEAALTVRRRHGFRRHLAETTLRGEAENQIRLDLRDEADSFDSLWDQALDAEAAHDDAGAEAAYRRCAAMRPRDPVTLLHLAEVVAALDRAAEARELLARALAVKPDFAEAWFALSRLESGAAVTRCLEQAVAADPDSIEAVHDLASIWMKEGTYDRALPLWERYLALAPRSRSPCADRHSVARAKRALMLCRMARLRPKANGTPAR